MATTANYNWPLPSPNGLQIVEMGKVANSLLTVDVKVKSVETALASHKHAFADLLTIPTTIAGYGITDAMTRDQVTDAIIALRDELRAGAGAALDTFKELADALGGDPNFASTISTALGNRVRVDAASAFSQAQKAQGRTNLDALGTVDKGVANGVATLDSTGKVPSAQLPALTTTATVGAAIAGANGKEALADGDFFTGVEAGGSTMFKATWGTLKAANTAIVNGIVAGNMPGRAYTRRSDGAAINWAWSGQGGQPSWLWGGNDGITMYVYNPANFSVNYANSSGSTGNANTVGGWDINGIVNQIENRGAAYADDRFSRAFKLNVSGQCIGENNAVNETKSFTNGFGGNSGSYYMVQGLYGGNDRGGLLCSNTGVSVRAISDYRLKPSVTPLVEFELSQDQFKNLDNVLLRIMAFRPVRHNWEFDPNEFTHGFLAHELQEVAPHSTTGEKDAVEDIGTAVVAGSVIPAWTFEKTELSEDGETVVSTVDVPEKRNPDVVYENVRQSDYPNAISWTKTGERPVYQVVDVSKLVPDLTAGIQSLTLMVLDLQARLAEFEANTGTSNQA